MWGLFALTFLLWGSAPKVPTTNQKTPEHLGFGLGTQCEVSEDHSSPTSGQRMRWGATHGDRPVPCTGVCIHLVKSFIQQLRFLQVFLASASVRQPHEKLDSVLHWKWQSWKQRWPRAERGSSLPGDSQAAAEQHTEPRPPVSEPSAKPQGY